MEKCRWLSLLACGVLFQAANIAAAARAEFPTPLVDSGDAAAVGLTRAWFSSVPLRPTRADGNDHAIDGDQLLLVDDTGMVTAMDANTGARQWTTVVNSSSRTSLGPAINGSHAAVVNGGRVYVLNRATGRIELIHDLDGAPGAAPAMSADRVFVPLINGMLQGFPLGDTRSYPWRLFSRGRLFTAPTQAGEYIFWATDRGDVYGANATKRGVRFRFEDRDAEWWSPVAGGSHLLAVSRDGYIVGLDTQRGRMQWRQSIGEATARPPIAVDGQLFVISRRGVLHCLDANSGGISWSAAAVTSLASVSTKNVYALGKMGRLLALDRETGEMRGQLSLREDVTAFVNDRTDRVFLLSSAGLVQCLHEIGQDEPVRHRELAAAAAAEAAESTAPDYPPAETTPSEDDQGDPFLDDIEPLDDDMFGSAPTEPTPQPSDFDAADDMADDSAEEVDDDLFGDDLFGD